MTRLGCFILTHRRPADLARSLAAILSQTRPPDVLLVVDNADDPEARAVVATYRDAGVLYHATERNLGSAGGVARGFDLMAQQDLDWVLSIDDDDPPKTDDTIARMVALMERVDDNVAIIGTNGSYWDWATGEHVRIPDEHLRGDLDIDIVGGGAQLTVRRDVLRQLGPPNPEFFFGHYDPLYCLRVKDAGYRVMIDGALMRDYREAAGRMGLTPQRRQFRPSHPFHSLWRRYYVTRNYVHSMRRTFDRPDLAHRMAAKSLVQSVGAWRNGLRYGARFTTMQAKGIVDGYLGRLGPRVSPVAKAT